MASHFYMSLSGVGQWKRALYDSGAQFAPYRHYLTTAKNAAEQRSPILSWRLPNLDEQQELERIRKASPSREKHAGKPPRRRERARNQSAQSGEWIILEPRQGFAEEPDATFEAFLDAKEIYQRPPYRNRGSVTWDVRSKIAIVDRDHERLAIKLAQLPTFIDKHPAPEHQVAEAEPLIFLKPNTWPLECQRRALESLENRPFPRLAPLLRLTSIQPTWDPLQPRHMDEDDWVFLRQDSDGSFRDGTHEQRQFVQCALQTPDFAVLEGPPGSGKTTAICELISQIARDGKRVLLVASTHVAVDNVLERLMDWQDHSDEKLVMPIRIGDESNVASPAIKPWVLGNLTRTWNAEILDYLDHPKDASAEGNAARVILQSALGSKSHNESLTNMILETSNLVCGTTIGILQHPAIKAAGSGHKGEQTVASIEPFDFLIIDEASKTTFSEFLVPALFAKRWIIVGDKRQLSPYVDEQDLAENVQGLLTPAAADAALSTFLASDALPVRMRRNSLLVIESDEQAKRLMEEAEARQVSIVNLDDLDPEQPCLEILCAQIVCAKPQTLALWEHRLPDDLCLGNGPVAHLPDWQAHRRARAEDNTPEPTSWAGEVAWRQVRAHELRSNPGEQRRYVQELQELIPRTLQNHERPGARRPRDLNDGTKQSLAAVLEEDLEQMRRVAMISILEILQNGAGSMGWRDETALTGGLPAPVLQQRLVSLSFQHRMHPDISAFPRQAFYSQAELLNDASGLHAARQWQYPRYARRAVWFDIAPGGKKTRTRLSGNRNLAEANVLMTELDEFVAWAQHNPRPGKNPEAPWEVAVLSFYKAQEKELRARLQRASGQRGNTRNFSLGRGRVKITLCTSDRFQGHEADLVLLSFVKSGSVGFLNSPNRLNVALTRARYQLVLIGHRAWMASRHCKSEQLKQLATSTLYANDLGWE